MNCVKNTKAVHYYISKLYNKISSKYLIILGTAFIAFSSTHANAVDQDTYNELCNCYADLPYGTATWYESNTKRTLFQTFNLHLPSTGQQNLPLIIFAHPNLMTKDISVTSAMYGKVVAPAIQAGFAVMSVEFRHPVVNDYIIPAPHYDIIKAIQYARNNAAFLGIDPKNIFLLGHSRGTLVAWSALQPDMAAPKSKNSERKQSTLVNAVYAYNAQATYEGENLADEFIIPEDRDDWVANWMQIHPQNDLFGSALKDISADDPPIMIKEEKKFYNQLVPASLIGAHLPDYGLRICQKYAAIGIGDKCQVSDKVSSDQAYVGYVDFFKLYLK